MNKCIACSSTRSDVGPKVVDVVEEDGAFIRFLMLCNKCHDDIKEGRKRLDYRPQKPQHPPEAEV